MIALCFARGGKSGHQQTPHSAILIAKQRLIIGNDNVTDSATENKLPYLGKEKVKR